MTDVPLVSVVVPVYDREHCVVDSVRSVLAQTHPAIECIVVDDGSTDGSVAALHHAFADDARVRVEARDHAGVSAARNHGITHARGELLTFLDSDDLMVEHRIARQLEHLRTTGDDAVMARQHQVLEAGATRPEWLERHPDWWDGYYHTSILVATARVRAIGGFDERLDIGEDIDLVVRLAGAGARVGVIDEPLTVHRFFGDNLSYASTDDFSVLLGAVRRHHARHRPSPHEVASLQRAEHVRVTQPGGAMLDADDVRAVLARTRHDWAEVLATATAATVTRDLRIADVDVRVVLAGDELAHLLLPAFDGLTPARDTPVATVGAWDAHATGVPFAPRPPVERDAPVRFLVRRDGRPVAEVEWSTADMLRTGDRDAACHLMAVTRASVLSPWEAGAPLRRQLCWALGPDVLFVHAAAVGHPDGAALIIGPSGAGKSSTSLACLRAGMGFLSDDYCLVRDDPPVVHRLHATARLHDDDVRHVDDFVAPAVLGAALRDLDEEAKALFHLHESSPDLLLASAPVRVVLVPERGDGPPGLTPMRPAEALRLIAPHALWQLSLEPAVELAGLRRLLTSVPCFRMRLSHDRRANPELVEEALIRTA